MAQSDPKTASAAELARAVRTRQASALELADAAIARIEALDGPINAVVVRDFDRARAAAREVDARVARGEDGALIGVPMTVKESSNVAGLPTTWGMAMFKDWIAPSDAVGVQRLKAAGAVILGKTNVPPMLGDWQSVNAIYGRTNNPWDLARTPGGSSGGSAAAVASGMTPLELGSDIGGSVRVPAAFCGVFGHKPTQGLVPLRGHAPPGVDAPDPDLAVLGPIARNVADLSLAMGVLAGPDGDMSKGYRLDLPPARGSRLSDFRVLLLTEHPSAPVDSEIRAAIEDLGERLEGAGAKILRRSAALPDLGGAHEVYVAMLGVIMSQGSPVPTEVNAHQWLMLQARQLHIRRRWAALFEEVDVVLAPPLGVLAFPHMDPPDPGGPPLDAASSRALLVDNAPTPYFGQLAWPGMVNVADLPATAMPIGLSRAGLPIGVQIIGANLEDQTTLAFAALVEQAFGGYQPPPK